MILVNQLTSNKKVLTSNLVLALLKNMVNQMLLSIQSNLTMAMFLQNILLLILSKLQIHYQRLVQEQEVKLLKIILSVLNNSKLFANHMKVYINATPCNQVVKFVSW